MDTATNITNPISTVIVMQKQTTACFRDVNLKNFTAATIIATAIISLTIQFFLENHHPIQNPMPMARLIKSNTLTLYYLISNNF